MMDGKTLALLVFQFMGQAVGTNFNAYSNNIETCLFQGWQSGSKAPLSGPVNCNVKSKQFQLCYNVNGHNPAQFAVCYNNHTLIPDFTGHVVEADVQTASGSCSWHDENGKFVPYPQSSVNDYKCNLQDGLYDNKGTNEQFCSRGHLTPNADFSTIDQRRLTFINVNIAPQWQAFNSINWANLEKAVRDYATSVKRSVYVFTGTGGQAQNSTGAAIILNKRVVAPKYYWKAVCDPGVNESVVFVAENPIGEIDTAQSKGCNNLMQTKKYGVIQCYSLNDVSSESGQFASANFVLPPFHDTNCVPSKRGTFMDSNLSFQ